MKNKELFKKVELYIQNDPSYKECIETGHIAERFDKLFIKLKQEQPAEKETSSRRQENDKPYIEMRYIKSEYEQQVKRIKKIFGRDRIFEQDINGLLLIAENKIHIQPHPSPAMSPKPQDKRDELAKFRLFWNRIPNSGEYMEESVIDLYLTGLNQKEK